MYRCNSDDDDAPTVMAPSAAPVTMPMLAVPRPSNVPLDIAEYANAFAAAEELAQAAAHVHATRYATPPPPARAPGTLPVPRRMSHAPHPTGPRTNAVVLRATPLGMQHDLDARRRHAQTFHIRGRKRAAPWASIALVTFVGVVACLSAMAAWIQFKDSPHLRAPRSTAPAAVLPVAAPAPAATVTIPTS